MAHLIDLSNARENMAYAAHSTPWHGLGSALDPDADLETWIEAAGFNWEVLKAPVLFKVEGSDVINKVPNRWVLHRSDTGRPLSVMSSNYQITQPRQVAEFFRELVGTAGFKMETMGMLRDGANYWALARVDDSFDLGQGDIQLPYLLIATSCDGTLSNVAQFTPIRVVCWNTITAAVAEGKERRTTLRIPHSTKFDAEKVKAELGLIDGAWATYKKTAKELTKRQVTKEEALKFMLDVFYPGKDIVPDPKIKRPALEKVVQLYESGVGQSTKTAHHTAWGLVNAITRFVDHEKESKSADNRLQAAWFGAGNLMKSRAWDEAVKLAA